MSKEPVIIDASNLVLGRLASFAAKRALQGDEVIVFNAENAVISGTKANIVEEQCADSRLGLWRPSGRRRRIREGLIPTFAASFAACCHEGSRGEAPR